MGKKEGGKKTPVASLLLILFDILVATLAVINGKKKRLKLKKEREKKAGKKERGKREKRE